MIIIIIAIIAISSKVISTELFGYDEGAFTGSRKGGSIGIFELANKGTIFLDEIGDMPLDLQAILLRVIEQKNFMRIGSNISTSVDVRIITATNKNLKEKIKQK
ncbi:MAG TPA: sigma 54-interacting transcriptional regulator, partial [Clostridium sp.]|uniref:sigma 54-interacting transcriptional regulator n=1 Tax=Clostridium sp. TaxID=1506 RepID=UPI002F91DFD1